MSQLTQQSEIITPLEHGDRLFHFARPVPLVLSEEGGRWLYATPCLKILAWGDTIEQAWAAYRYEFAACWDHYAQEQDINLTEDGKEMRNSLRNFVDRVEGGPTAWHRLLGRMHRLLKP